MTYKGPPQITRHHLIQHVPPTKVVRNSTDLVCLSPEGDGLIADERHRTETTGIFQMCPISLKPGDRAIILKISELYTHSDLEVPILLETQPLFEKQQETGHPDYTGSVLLPIPGTRPAGVIPKEARVLYEPNLINAGIPVLQYAGMENAILEARSSCLTSNMEHHETSHMAFLQTDPLVAFLLAHKQHFKGIDSDEIRLTGASTDQPVYLIKHRLVERIQKFFSNHIFPLFHYTQEQKLLWKMPTHVVAKPSDRIMILISVDYMVVTPSVPTMPTTCTILN